jgi:hypothetical protein
LFQFATLISIAIQIINYQLSIINCTFLYFQYKLGPFGIKSESSGVSMDSLMKGSFGKDDNTDADYPNIGHIKKTGAYFNHL